MIFVCLITDTYRLLLLYENAYLYLYLSRNIYRKYIPFFVKLNES